MHNNYDAADVNRMIHRLAGAIVADYAPSDRLNIVGIRTRGHVLAERITELVRGRGYDRIGQGVLDITLYRDDLSEIGPRPLVRPTQLKISIDSAPLILVDDVLFTGRSVRAALDALSDFGRPSVIRLAALVDRDGRELPIQPDYVGLIIADVPRDHRVNVRLMETDGDDAIQVQAADRPDVGGAH